MVLKILTALLITVLIVTIVGLNINTQEVKYKEPNYIGLTQLGLAPSTYSRQVQENDIDTGIKFTDGENVYSLINSRTWNTGDYGKTFIIKSGN